MKKRFSALLLALVMVLTLTAPAFAADSSNIQLTVTKTDVKADSVVNYGGYGSLTIDGDYDSDPLDGISAQLALIDRDGKFVFPYQAHQSDGDARFRYSDGIVSLTASNYDEWMSPEPLQYYSLNGNSIFTLEKTVEDHINEDGTSYRELMFWHSHPMMDGYAVVAQYGIGVNDKGEWGEMINTYKTQIIDKTGKVTCTLPDTYNYEHEHESEGTYSYIKMSLGWCGEGLFALFENILTVYEYGSYTDEHGNTSNYSTSTVGKGYMDPTGKTVIDLEGRGYTNLWPFHQGLAAVQDANGKIGFINKNGTLVIPCTYDGAGSFGEDGLCAVKQGEKWGYIDKTGKVIIPFEYDGACGSGGGLASVVKNGKCGLVDQNNKVVVPLEYDGISSYEGSAAYGIKDGIVYIFTDGSSGYIYDVPDPGEEMALPVDRLDRVTDPASAASAVKALTDSMTSEQKQAPTCVDLATLYAENAAAKAASKAVNTNEIVVSAATVADLEQVAAQASQSVENALSSGGITVARDLAAMVTLTTDAASELTIRVEPDVLTTQVDKVRISAPTFSIVLDIAELEEVLTENFVFTAEDVGTGFDPVAPYEGMVTVDLKLPKTATVTVALPTTSGKTTYQTVTTTEGTAAASKYNPATTKIEGKVNTSGKYTVTTNEVDFSDISSKSAEMQKAIRYLASKGIITGTTSSTFSPDGSISRAEIAALLVRALGWNDNSAAPTFKDVFRSNWYYSAAASSQKHGLINGFPDNTFLGGTAISKEQILAVSSRVLVNKMGYKIPANAGAYLTRYKDGVTSWAQGEVALATKENLVVYRVDGTFKGAGSMTRGDAAIVVYRLFQKIW